jgi:hypothetical protein
MPEIWRETREDKPGGCITGLARLTVENVQRSL